ncbi:hypothetical protein Taro_011362 [Colocasia esculenta]|uniref:Nucleolar 27S pre-rRNA processing Urb2/Npa2 C-terminal domain-containing protein n=1 Tax=Colocasia esculenta TaxID=4460 RepID=A0A843U5P4_COLES|nr:hypothetical protein [Colocasia esculenta]
MAKHEATCLQASGKKRKRHASPPAQEEEVEAAVQQEDTQKNPPQGGVWKNLDLVLSLQDRAVPVDRKIELAFDFVTSGPKEQNQGRTPFQFPRVVSFLGDWVQPLLISSDHDKRKSSAFADACLDRRPWVVLKFCSENSVISISQNLLRAITRVLIHVTSALERDNDSTAGKDSTGFYGTFSELLEPLLELLVLLNLRAGDGSCEYASSFLTVVKDILSNGLFHPVHITGFLSSRSLNMKTEVQESKSFNESYHRHFFARFNKIITEKKVVVMGGFGSLFCLFITIVRKKRGVSLPSKAINKLEKEHTISKEENDTNKPLFDVFVQFMEPLVLECKRLIEIELSCSRELLETKLIETHGTIRTCNDILKSFMLEKVYERTQDSPEGAHYNFLNKVYDTIIGLSRKMYLLWLSIPNMHEVESAKMLFLIAKELIVSVGYFVEIEYKIIGDDLTGIWFMMLSYLAVHLSTAGTVQDAFLTNEILRVGCVMVNVYSELRQVGSWLSIYLIKILKLYLIQDASATLSFVLYLESQKLSNHIAEVVTLELLPFCASRPIFALCEAVRLFRFCGEIGCTTFVPFRYLSSDAYVKGVIALLCSQVMKSAVSNAIKSIPEGQASGCVQQLRSDFTESLKWTRERFIKTNGVYNSKLLIEDRLFGCLSEMYSTVLESLTVTASNSISIVNSIDDLMITIRLIFSSFAQNQSDNLHDFFISFTGRKLTEHVMPHSKGSLDTFGIFLVFFRLYVACRSIYLQTISLMPPDSSKKAASAVSNLFSVSSGLDWEAAADWTDGGYFSWIIKPSVSLLFITQLVSKTFSADNISACAPLVFVLHVMALQRLTDLNRQIKSFEYLAQRDVKLAQMQVLDGAEHLPYKKNKRWKRLLKIAKQEAADLTNFMMEYLSLLRTREQLEFFQKEKVGEGQEMLLTAKDSWDMGVCSLNERSLPIAIWWLLCENIDIWCVHSSKRSLKEFSHLLVHHAISCVQNCGGDTIVPKRWEPSSQRKVMVHHISINLLNNIAFYEQPVLLRNFTSKLSGLLKKSILPAVTHTFGSNMNLSSLPDLSEILSSLGKEPFLPDYIHSEDCAGWELSPTVHLEIRMCQALLFLFCKLPEVHKILRSLSVIVAYILHLERLLVLMLLSCPGEYFQYGFLSLFVSCRQTLRHLLVAAVDDKMGTERSSDLDTLFGSPSLVQWLLKSASRIVGMSYSHFGDEHPDEVSKMFFMLMDHTSYLFQALSEAQVNEMMHSVLTGENLLLDQPMHHVLSEMKTSSEVELLPNSSGGLDAWKRLEIVASVLRNEARISLLTLRNIDNVGDGAGIMALNWNNLSNTLSCLQGFLWSFVSAMGNIDEKCSNEDEQQLVVACISELYNCISVFEELVDCCLKQLLLDHHPAKEAETANCVMSNPVDNPESHHLRLPLLQSLLKCEDPEVGFSIRQLFLSAAAILKLRHLLSFLKGSKVKDNCNYMCSNSASILVATSDFILSEMTDFERMLQHSDLLWIGGVLKYLEVFGSCFPMTDSALSENMYLKMINIHLRAIGKCICLQGKAATLASHETGSYTKMLQSELQERDNMPYSVEEWGNKLSEFKARLRMSFKELLRRPLRSDLVVVVQTLERVLVGVRQGCNMVYEISAGHQDGGKVSDIVAAGIDCFDLVFDSFSGRKLLGIIRSCIQNIIGSLFNIILHLQNPLIFYRKNLSSNKNTRGPDPGSVICMCVEMLTKIAQKHSQLKVDASNVGKSLHVPASLFKHFHQLKTFRLPSNCPSFLKDTEGMATEHAHHFSIDHQFCIDLYASSCKLLCTILRHQTSEAACCISLLEDSVKVLLTCLESTDADVVSQKGYFVLTTQESVKCASYLRRVYEEWDSSPKFGRGVPALKMAPGFPVKVKVQGEHVSVKDEARKNPAAQGLRTEYKAQVQRTSSRQELQKLHTTIFKQEELQIE